MLALTVALLPVPAWAESRPAPAPPPPAPLLTAARARTFTVHGAGYGHGWGMSPYGAYGAARQGLSWRQILRFYYPGTKPARQRTRAVLRVWVSADADDELLVLPARGLKVTGSSGHRHVLPSGSSYTAWRVRRSGTNAVLSYRKPSGAWVRQRTLRKTWWISNGARLVSVVLPGGSRQLRGSVTLVADGHGGRTVNRVFVEEYVRGVVPLEMPTSWSASAVRAQAVAARSYAVRLQASRRGRGGYDLCDTSSCQVYRGYASVVGGHLRRHETPRGNAAVSATSRVVLRYRGKTALTQFASSNGGSTAQGDYPYLPAKLDRYDGVVKSQNWTRKITASRIAHAYPSAGTVRRVTVTKRNGVGRWGGRVETVKIVGSRHTVKSTGRQFQGRLGLRSNLFRIG